MGLTFLRPYRSTVHEYKRRNDMATCVRYHVSVHELRYALSRACTVGFGSHRENAVMAQRAQVAEAHVADVRCAVHGHTALGAQ